MFITQKRVPRRAVLKGIGATVALPLPHSRREMLPGLTHLGPMEDPSLLAQRIRAAFAAG